MTDWEKLRLRYGSKRQYLNRSTKIYNSNFEDFLNFLADNGCDVSTELAQDEMIRFRFDGELGIIYSKGSGNLLGHDMADKYWDSIK